ncbi:hypothetical protein HW555_011057 [Spodoptera exigua]|uniref:Uncharacterized protein n=1 Tax=Spodoptera exigua TaxID=7107 RepID=A0A835L0C0_SPOEX|nr:hypothetical protein HW555_011057 [Spodoptera exigua]
MWSSSLCKSIRCGLSKQGLGTRRGAMRPSPAAPPPSCTMSTSTPRPDCETSVGTAPTPPPALNALADNTANKQYTSYATIITTPIHHVFIAKTRPGPGSTEHLTQTSPKATSISVILFKIKNKYTYDAIHEEETGAYDEKKAYRQSRYEPPINRPQGVPLERISAVYNCILSQCPCIEPAVYEGQVTRREYFKQGQVTKNQ